MSEPGYRRDGIRHMGDLILNEAITRSVGTLGRSEGGAGSHARSIGPTRDRRSAKDKAKPYGMSRQEILEAYWKMKSNKGAAGIDEQTISDFERDLKISPRS